MDFSFVEIAKILKNGLKKQSPKNSLHNNFEFGIFKYSEQLSSVLCVNFFL